MTEDLDTFEVLPWNNNFETGIEIIDEQHKKLVELLNQLTISLIDDDLNELNRIFDELAAYAKYHFETEEEIWKPCFVDDNWMKEHQHTHDSFLPAVLDLKEKFRDKPLRDTTEHIVKFLIRWLAFHIIDSDRRMAIVVLEKQKGMSLEEAKSYSNTIMTDSAHILTDTILTMYDELSSRTLSLMRERQERIKVQKDLSIANEELKQLAVTDQLTGLYNRRHFNSVFEQELRRAKRNKRCLSFIMLDIDYFKKLNDHYGHVEGDNALKGVAKRLQEICQRPGDFVFRLGGEEFGVLCADRCESKGNDLAEKIRREIEELRIPNLTSEVSNVVTVSVGVLSRVPENTDTVESFMRDVDARLYSAKDKGRNTVIHLA